LQCLVREELIFGLRHDQHDPVNNEADENEGSRDVCNVGDACGEFVEALLEGRLFFTNFE